tara:strand:- start:3723 stop:4616 length:894 start_codon:yes stop_codon:yes gene_type:complete
MKLVNIFKLGNDIEGNFVEVGFGRGQTAKLVFDAMNSGTLTKRNSTLIDSFRGMGLPTTIDLRYDSSLQEGQDPGRYQVAMDMRYELGNHFSISVIKSYVDQHMINLYNKEIIACLHIDLPSYTAIVNTLEFFKQYLNRDAIIFISGYKDSLGVTRAVDTYIEDNELTYQLFNDSFGYYIKNKIPPVFYTKPSTTREFLTPENLIKVQRTKRVAFTDRYIKPIVQKFKPKKDILTNVTGVGSKVAKQDIDTPEDIIPVSRTKITPFEDRYEKKVTKKFKPTPVVKEGLDVIDKKVSR